MKPVIVVVAFNRPRSLQRLLTFLSKAEYPDKDVTLIISIDKGDNQNVLSIANEFVWEFGEKIVDYQKENLKLRKHILKCGSWSEKYGSVIVLEDDLIVSPYFYNYAMQALRFAENREYIGGVSLYNHRWNVNVSEPFEIMDDSFDNWYFQFASSWGQAWTAKQWKNFKDWYAINESKDLHSFDMPEFVANWSSSSWLKYFIKYLIETNKYFIYPKKSLTSNFSDAGTHVNNDNTNYQVPFDECERVYHFSDLENSRCVYDAFFESQRLLDFHEIKATDVTVDLYGSKTESKTRYWLSRKILNYSIVANYGCSMRPHEANILYNIPGEDFFLYDTSVEEKNNRKFNAKRKSVFNHRYILLRDYLPIFETFIDTISIGIKKRLKRRRR